MTVKSRNSQRHYQFSFVIDIAILVKNLTRSEKKIESVDNIEMLRKNWHQSILTALNQKSGSYATFWAQGDWNWSTNNDRKRHEQVNTITLWWV